MSKQIEFQQEDRTKSLKGNLNTACSDQGGSNSSQTKSLKGNLNTASYQCGSNSSQCYNAKGDGKSEPHIFCLFLMQLMSQLTWSTVRDCARRYGRELLQSTNMLCYDAYQILDQLIERLTWSTVHDPLHLPLWSSIVTSGILLQSARTLCSVVPVKVYAQSIVRLVLSTALDYLKDSFVEPCPLWISDIIPTLHLVVLVASSVYRNSERFLLICCESGSHIVTLCREGSHVILAIIAQLFLLLLMIILRVLDSTLPKTICVCVTAATAIFTSDNMQEAVIIGLLAAIPALQLSAVFEASHPYADLTMLLCTREHVPTTGQAGRVRRGLARFAMGKMNTVCTSCLTHYDRLVDMLDWFSPLTVPLRLGILMQASVIRLMLKSLTNSLRARNWSKRYNWRILLFLWICVAGITPCLGMD